MSARIAYLTGRAWRGKPLPHGQLPSLEAPDFARIAEAGAAIGLRFDVCAWDDPGLPEAGFDAALIRSCWDYPERSAEFIATLEARERAGLRIFNSSAVVRWNARKTYLRDLENKGAPVIPTLWLDALDGASVARAFSDFETAELVLKPQIGAGARNTIRLKRNAWSEADLFAGPQGPAMAQPYLPRIETDGEVSLFYFGGALSHVLRKVPAQGHWLANALDARFSAIEADAAAVSVAEAALAAAEQTMLYVRVDLAPAASGDWRVIELEAIEPHLFLGFSSDGAARLAGALAAALRD